MWFQLQIVSFLTLLGFGIQTTNAVNNSPFFVTQFPNGTQVDGTLNQRLTTDGLSEDLTKGSKIGNVICGDPDGDPITYKIESNSLSIDSTTGLVTLQVALDREGDINNTSLVKPKFICEDGRGLSATADVDITIKDVNDNRPTFLNEPYKANVPEDLDIGSTLVTNPIIVVDPDELFNAIVKFKCIGNPEACSTFQLHSTMLSQGRYELNLTLLKRLNYENIKSYTFSIFAEDQGEKNKLSSTKNVGIEVKDRQDTLPIILNTPIALTVDENIPLNTVLPTRIMAQDGDTGDARPIKIVIIDDSDPKKLFRIGTAVKMNQVSPIYEAPVIINKEIDREKNNSRYEFKIKAIELFPNGSESQDMTIASVTVDILDKNDNIPIFSSPKYTVNLTEQDTLQNKGNTQLPDLNIQVTDADYASNAKYTLAIEQQTFPVFRISPEQEILGNTAVQLIIVNTSYLDYDTPMYRTQTLVLIAKESKRADGMPSLTSTTTVIINLIDLNDNSPEFNKSVYNMSLPENTTLGSEITTLTATDNDEGLNGQIRYSVRGTDNSIFKVDAITGRVTLNQTLDYETEQDHRIQYLATDLGQPPRTTEVAFTLYVLNVNDVAPKFDKEIYRTFAFETSLDLRPTIQVKATDEEGGNVTYRILSGNSPNNSFMLDRNTGTLSLQHLLDYDQTENKRGYFTLIIEASDNGSPAMTSNSSIIITVQNENNHSPEFSQLLYTKNITEISSPGTSVLRITATDDDTELNGEILYRIASGGDENFELNKNTGVLTISKKVNFDYNVVKMYKLKVYATDQGTQPRTATSKVEINIIDANNKDPSFKTFNYHRNIEESKPIGTFVLFVEATDKDTDHKLEYSILTNSVKAHNKGGSVVDSYTLYDIRTAFEIDKSSGLIKTAMNLSRDVAAEIQFAVQVQDVKSATGIQTATTSVNIIILGRNVSTIVFDPPWTKLRPIHQFLVPEGIRTEPITTLIARDPLCACTLRNYQIIPGSARPVNVFRVDRFLGTVTIQPGVELDYESDTRVYTVQVVATSSDRRTAVTTIRVEISDINDNPPQFEVKKYSFNQLESYAYPSVVGYITANDADSRNFGNVEYILSGSGNEDFKIFNQQGLLIINKNVKLDYEKKKKYNLLVSARDNPGNNSQSAVYYVTTVPVEINILDVNDNIPQFTGLPYKLTVVETAELGTSVGKIQATDKDSGQNAEIVYSLDDKRGLFRINPISGVILTRRSLSGLSEYFSMNVTATDRGYPSLHNSTLVSIDIKSGQLDDGTPDWKVPQRGVVAYVVEAVRKLQHVLTARATAKSTNATVIYSFLTTINNDHTKFKMNRMTGEITTDFFFDREKKDKFELILMATDSTNHSIVSYRNLVILVNDSNDNVPTFDSCIVKVPNPLTVTLRENSPVATSVYRVKACDPDLFVNQADYVPYKGTPDCNTEWAKQNFYLSSRQKGVIMTKKVLDREKQEYYLVCVEAKPASRRKRSVYDEDRMDRKDVVAYIIVRLLDANDNRPEFPNKAILLGIETMPQISQQVARVLATDKDLSPYDRTLYDIVNIEYYDPDPDRPNYSIRGAFRINRDNGIIVTNLPSYTDYVQSGSYFVVEVIATDFNNPKLNDTMSVLLFVYEPTQSLRVVFNERPSEDVQKKAMEMINRLSLADTSSVFQLKQVAHHRAANMYDITSRLSLADTSSVFQLKQVAHHRAGDMYNVTRTDVCFVVIREYRVTNIYEGTSYLKNNEKISQVLKDYRASEPGACTPKRTSMDSINWGSLWWVLVAVAIFIFICCLILIVAIIILYRNYKNFMNTRKIDLLAQDEW